MKRNLLILITVLLVNALTTYAQKKNEIGDVKYRRSSLHTILLESGDFLNKDLVIGSYNLAPFPDKYNDHRLDVTTIDPNQYKLSAEDLKAAKAANVDSTSNKKEKNADKEIPYIIAKYFDENKIANQMVAKWFGRDENGQFNMELIHERGSYDASAIAAQMAKGDIRGNAALKDAGEELIKNTFIVINSMNFVENEPIARGIRDAAFIIADQLPNEIAAQIARTAAVATYETTKDGYSVWATSYLFQLEWNDDIANTFYSDMWYDPTWGDSTRIELFDNSDIFKLNYVGFEKAKSLVLFSVGKSEKEIIQLATIRNVDKVYTKLQKAYDVFKTKTPIYSTDPIMAKIGLKEGIEDNDKFDVLEQTMDEKTGLTKYVKVATIKVDKKNVWDNRYNMGNEDEIPENAKLEGTYFKGGGKIEPGMLLRQVK